MDMGKYNKASKGNISVLGTMISFIVLGTIFIIIAYHNDICDWINKYGLTLLVIAIPVLLFIIYQFGIKKIKEM